MEISSNTNIKIPNKRYFTIGEVSKIYGIKSHVLRYWEQEFTQRKPIKRRGNRRYYQRHDVLLIRQIKELLYDSGYTIKGAKQKLTHEESEKVSKQSTLSDVRSDLEAIIDILD